MRLLTPPSRFSEEPSGRTEVSRLARKVRGELRQEAKLREEEKLSCGRCSLFASRFVSELRATGAAENARAVWTEEAPGYDDFEEVYESLVGVHHQFVVLARQGEKPERYYDSDSPEGEVHWLLLDYPFKWIRRFLVSVEGEDAAGVVRRELEEEACPERVFALLEREQRRFESRMT